MVDCSNPGCISKAHWGSLWTVRPSSAVKGYSLTPKIWDLTVGRPVPREESRARPPLHQKSKQTLRHALDFHRLAAGVVNFNHRAVQHHAFRATSNRCGMPVRKRLSTGSISRPRNAFVRAGEPGVGQIRRAAGENLLVRRLHVRVRAHHRAHLAVQHPRERNLFRGRLGVKIHEDDFASARAAVSPRRARARNGFSSGGCMNVRPCTFITAIEGRPGLPDFGLQNRAALAGRAGRIIQRTQKTFFVLQQFHDFLLVPQMVAAGDDVHAGAEKISPAMSGVMPEPPAEFSPLAMTKSSACCSRSLGRSSLTARVPVGRRCRR